MAGAHCRTSLQPDPSAGPAALPSRIYSANPVHKQPQVCANPSPTVSTALNPLDPRAPAAGADASPGLSSPHTRAPARHTLCHLERDTAAASRISEPEDCQTHLAVSGHPAPLALSHGSGTKPRLYLCTSGITASWAPGVAAREHELTVGSACLRAEPFLEMSAARTCHFCFTALPQRDVTE